MNLIRETKTICLNQTKIIMHHFTHKHSGSGGSNVVESTASKSKGLPSIPPVARAFFSSSVFKCSVLNCENLLQGNEDNQNRGREWLIKTNNLP